MKITQHRHRLFNLTRVRMVAGEAYMIPAAENDVSIGVWCVQGGARHHPSASAAPAVHLPQAGEGLLLNDGETAWSSDAAGHNDLNLLAPVNTEWVCVGDNGAGRHALTALVVHGEAAVPAGAGVIVVSGTLSLDGRGGGPDAWFRPRDHALVLTGEGEAILVAAPAV